MRNHLAALFVLVVVLTGACGTDDDTTADTTAQDQTEATAAPDSDMAATEPSDADDADTDADTDAAGTTVTVGATELGDVLTDSDGNTLYLFLPDEQGASTCYDDCEQNWPPLTGPAQAGTGVDASLLATVDRDDGTSQVTYNDWPLYYFAGDSEPGDTAGQGVGDVWFVVDATGEPVQEVAAADEGAY